MTEVPEVIRLRARIAKLERAIELHELESDYNRLNDDVNEFMSYLALAFDGQWKDPKHPSRLRPGRPGKWKGRLGFELVCGVLDFYGLEQVFNNPPFDRNVAEAIRQLREQNPELKEYSVRDLERRFQEVKEYWLPLVALYAHIHHQMNKIEAKLKARGL